MRTRIVIGLAALSIVLIVCAIVARRSKKPLSHDVHLMLLCLLPPIVGNLIIIYSSDWLISRIGDYVYFIGLDFTILALIRFTAHYCSLKWEGTVLRKVVIALMAIDVIQLLLNPVFGHAFTTEEIIVEGLPYYSLVPLLGQSFHRIVVYGVFFMSVGVFVYKTLTAPRIYVERYLVILVVMVFTGIWQSYYIFSGSPIDQSMIGFGVFGLLVFYFALYYKPMRLLDRMLASVVSDIKEAVFFFDRDGSCIYVNDYGNTLFDIKSNADREASAAHLIEAADINLHVIEDEWAGDRSLNASLFKGKLSAKASDAQAEVDNQRFFHLEFHKLRDERNRPVGSFLRLRDRTEEELKLQRERRNAIHDPLTGLYNASHLYEAAQRRIANDRFRDYCVVGIDIREFKLVNDIFNREFGNTVLCKLADDIKRYSTPNEIYGRISGDRFGFVIPKQEFEPEAVEEYLNSWDINEEGMMYPIIIHMGIYEVDNRSLPVPVMFDRAFMAIASIKHDHRRHVAFYDSRMRENAIWNQKISAELDDAIESGQIVPYLQPVVNELGKVVGAEALVRWIHPEEGFLSPARFIPYFEENGRIAQLDQHMWECACRILAQWKEAGIDLFLSVNISPKDFYFIDVYKSISDLVAKYDIDPSKLRLEITETVMMSDIENRLRIIEGLRAEGFIVEMDDFGSGYSSLNMLKDIPVDVLKIDMMFLYKTRDQDRAQTILQTIINLTQDLGIPSVTEGVETAEQLNMLVHMGCHTFQGYYFAQPMPRETFEENYCQAA